MTIVIATRQERSFTLVEILTATSVLSILAVIMFGILQQTSRGWQAANRRVESVQSVRLALDQITSDLENCLVVVRSNVPLPITNFSNPNPIQPTANYAFGFAHSNEPGTLPQVFSVNRSRIEMAPFSDSIAVVTPFFSSLGQGTNLTGSDLCETGYFVVFVRDTNGYSTMRGQRYYLLRHRPMISRSGSDYFPDNDFLTNSTNWENTPSANPISTTNRVPFIDNCLVFDVRFLSGQPGSFTTNITWGRPSTNATGGWIAMPNNVLPGLPKAALLTVCVVDERTAERLGRWFPAGLSQANLTLVQASVTNPAALNTVIDQPPGVRSTLREGVVGFQRLIYFKNATN